MYDRNGLQLSTAKANTLNSYRLTAVDLKNKKYAAYARASKPKGNMQWSMFNIGNLYKDPRDAAYVAQEFEKIYNPDQVRQMVTDGVFYDVAREFVENTDIPDWQFPAEGILIEDILNDYGYKNNYVSDAKSALQEAVKVFGIKVPSLKEIPSLISQVENLYKDGCSYREAARKVMNVNEGEAV
jgi:hypothetical protein